jgi:AraC-like DNA-binding protein
MKKDQSPAAILDFTSVPAALSSYVAALNHLAVKAHISQIHSDPEYPHWKTVIRHNGTEWIVYTQKRTDESMLWLDLSVEQMLGAMENFFNPGPDEVPHSAWPSGVKISFNLISKHADRPLSLKELSTCLNTSASYLGMTYTRVTGATFRQMLRDERIRRACKWLADGTYLINEIPSKLGGMSLSQLNRSFLAATGMAPTAWMHRFRPERSLQLTA